MNQRPAIASHRGKAHGPKPRSFLTADNADHADAFQSHESAGVHAREHLNHSRHPRWIEVVLPAPFYQGYGVAKPGIVRLVETIAEEESDRAYDINAIAPGAINTRLTDEVIALGPTVVGEAGFAAAQKQKASGGTSLEKALGLVEKDRAFGTGRCFG